MSNNDSDYHDNYLYSLSAFFSSWFPPLLIALIVAFVLVIGVIVGSFFYCQGIKVQQQLFQQQSDENFSNDNKKLRLRPLIMNSPGSPSSSSICILSQSIVEKRLPATKIKVANKLKWLEYQTMNMKRNLMLTD